VTAAPGDDLPDAIFLPVPLRLLDVLDLDPFLGGDAVDVSTNRLPERIGEQRSVVEHPNVASVEERLNRLRVADARDRSLDHDAVEAGEDADDLAGATIDQAGPSTDDTADWTCALTFLVSAMPR